MLGALPMLRSGEPYFVFSGLVVVFFLVSPILPGLVRVLRRKFGGAPAPAEPELLPARVEDLPSLQALPLKDADWATWLADPDAAIVCLKWKGQVVGAAAGRKTGEQSELLAVYTPPALRGRYLGSLMVDSASAALAEKGALGLTAAVPAHRRPPLAFLSAQGWSGETLIFKPGPIPTFQRSLVWLRSWWQGVRRHGEAH
jgi:hypothetical protein